MLSNKQNKRAFAVLPNVYDAENLSGDDGTNYMQNKKSTNPSVFSAFSISIY